MNLVFDFGAVLVDWQPAQLLKAHFSDLATTPQDFQQLANSIFSHSDWQAFDRGSASIDEVVHRTAQRLGLSHKKLHGMVSGIAERLTPIDETVKVLGDLQQRSRLHGDVHLYFLSNMPAPYARALEQRFAFVDWFEGGIFSGDVQHIKPELAIYRLLQSRYQLEPGQTLFIDDLKSNVEAACGLGWGGVHFLSAQQLRNDLANLLG